MNKQELENLFHKKGLTRIWGLIDSKIKNGITISHKKAKESTLKLGQSKLGGTPDLPKNINWFNFNDKPMSFIAQINLSEASDFDIENKLPKTGILYFFYDAEQETWGFDPKDRNCSKVYYYKGDITELERKSIPENLDEYSIFKACKLSFSTSINLPNFQSSVMDSIQFTEEEEEAFDELIEEIDEDDEINKLLGHSDNIQGGMELDCELVTNDLYCGDGTGYRNPKAKLLKNNIDLWHLLLQVDSNDKANMMWGDLGRLYFWIRENDLKAENFENSWLILQCG